MRIAWAVTVAVLLVGCGSSDGEVADALPGTPTASANPLPKFDPATQRRAQKLLDAARDQLLSDGGVSFRSTVDLLGATLTLDGALNFDDEASEFEQGVKGVPVQDLGGEAAFQYRIRKTHVYGSPTYGPFDKCWFHYGDSNPLFQENPSPWLHVAVAAAADAEALGMAEGSEDSVMVEVPAIELLSITSSKLVRLVADQLTEDLMMARAVMEIDEGRYTALRFNIDEVFEALEDGGVDLTVALESALKDDDIDVAQHDVGNLLKAYFGTTQRVTYEHGIAVPVVAPPPDELMDATDITDPENLPDRRPKLCAAAG